jgi:hypothetical protein
MNDRISAAGIEVADELRADHVGKLVVEAAAELGDPRLLEPPLDL